ncbi:MAG: hypothetical protein NVSMB65_02530 [Chloroflexota bacterium]
MRILCDRLVMRLARRVIPAQGAAPAPVPVVAFFVIGSLVLWQDRIRRAIARLGAEHSASRRFVLLILGLAALGGSQNVGHRFGQGFLFLDGVLAATLLACALILFAVVLAPPYDLVLFRRGPRLILGTAALGGVMLAGASTGQIGRLVEHIRLLPQHTQFGNDAITMSSCATNLLLKGRNPYTDATIITCLWDHGYYRDGNLTTPLQQGHFAHILTYPSRAHLDRELQRVGINHIQHPREFESQICYPAGSFLFPALATLLKIDDLRFFFLLCFVGAYLYIAARAPRALRLWVVAIAFINMAVWTNAVSGASDALYIAFVLLGWSLRRQPVPSSIAWGLAATARQQSWFFLLFFAVLIAREEGLDGLWRRGRIIGGIFLVTNLPFIILSPAAWLNGVLSPVLDPMFPMGSGLVAVALGASGAIPLAPRGVYSVLEGIALVACLVTYARVCRRWPHLGLVLAVVPLFVAWRSLFSYFYPATIPILGALLETPLWHPTPRARALRPRVNPRPMAVRVTRAKHLDLSA